MPTKSTQQIQYKLYIQSQTQFPSVHLFSLSTPGGRFSHRFYSIIISANKLSPYVIPMVLPLFHFTFGRRPSLSLVWHWPRWPSRFVVPHTFSCFHYVSVHCRRCRSPHRSPQTRLPTFFFLFWLFGFSFSIAYINNNLTSFIHFY